MSAYKGGGGGPYNVGDPMQPPGAGPVAPGTLPAAGQMTPAQQAYMNAPAYQQGSLPPGADASTSANPFNALVDPQQAIYRALLAKGLNPDKPTWGINQLLKRAEDIVYSAVGRAVHGGQQDMLAGPGLQDLITELVGRSAGIGGPAQGIIGGAGAGAEALNAINKLISGPEQGMGASFLNTLFGTDPQNAMSLTESLMYGGLNSKVRDAVGRPLRSFPARFAQYAETPEGYAATENRSALDVLMSQLIPNYQPLGSAGTPAAPAPAGPLSFGGPR